MANAYSILHNYDQPVYEPNLDLVTKVLSYKQQKLDTGRQKLQSLYDEFSMLDIYKDSDREYAEERLNQVKSMVDRYASGDLSSDALVRDIASNMDNFVDDNVINAVVSTKSFKSDLSTWNKVREEEPERFGEQNYNYALTRAQNYLANDKIGQKYNGEASFIEYVDVDKRLLEEMPKAMKALKEEFVELTPGSGIFYDKVTMERVPRNRMERVMKLSIGQDGYRQLGINAWSESQSYGEGQIRESYNSFYSSQLSQLNNDIQNTKNLISKKTGQDREALKESLRNKESQRSIIQNRIDSSSQMDKVSMYQDLYTKRYEDDVLSAYSYDSRVIKRELDQNSFQTKKYAMDVMKVQASASKASGRLNDPSQENRLYTAPVSDAISEEEGYKRKAENLFETFWKRGNENYKNFKSIIGDDISDSQSVDLLSKIEESMLGSKSSVTIELYDGTTKTLDFTNPETVRYVREMKNYLDGNDPDAKMIRESIRDLRSKVFSPEDNRSTLQDSDVLTVASTVPKLFKQTESGLELVDANSEDIQRAVRSTLSKINARRTQSNVGGFISEDREMTSEDNANMNLWRSVGLISDRSVPLHLKEESYSTFMSEYINQGYDLKELETILGEALAESEFIEGDFIQDLSSAMSPSLSSAINPFAASVAPLTGVGAALGASARRASDRSDVSFVDKKYLKAFNSIVSEALEKSSFFPETKAFTVPDSHTSHEAIRNMVHDGIGLESNYKGSFKLTPVLGSEGQMSGEYYVEYANPSKYAEGVTEWIATKEKLTEEQFAQAGISVGDVSASRYDVRTHGENAPVVQLGSSAVDISKLQASQKELGDLPTYTERFWSEMDQSIQAGGLEEKDIKRYTDFQTAFKNGDIQFRLTPNKSLGYVYEIIGRNKEVLMSKETGFYQIAEDMVDGFYLNSPGYKNDLVIEYISRIIGDSQSNSDDFINFN